MKLLFFIRRLICINIKVFAAGYSESYMYMDMYKKCTCRGNNRFRHHPKIVFSQSHLILIYFFYIDILTVCRKQPFLLCWKEGMCLSSLKQEQVQNILIYTFTNENILLKTRSQFDIFLFKTSLLVNTIHVSS